MTPILGTTSSLGARGYGFLEGQTQIVINTQPTSTSSVHGSTATFTISASLPGGGIISYQWQRSDDSGSTWNNVGSNSNSYTTPSLTVLNDNTDRYRCILSSPNVSSVTSSEAVLTVSNVITISSHPSSTSVSEGSTATFSVSATVTAGGVINYQWQRSDDSGSTWNNVGSNSNSYTTPSLTNVNDNNDRYRCVLSSANAANVTSNEAVLTVTSIIDFTINPAIGGKTSWSLASDGALIFDSSNETTYTIVAQRNISQTVKMWGQGRSGGTGGYSTGTISFNSGSTYTVKLNYGGGNAGTGYGSRSSSAQSGGGLAGMFVGTGINQGSAMMIAGGAGGGGDGTSGGGGGGPSGNSGQTSPDSQISSTGGGGGSSGSGGSAGGPSDTNVYYRLPSSQNVSFFVTEDSGYFNRLNIQGIKNFPENNAPNPETIFVNAGTYLVTATNDTTGFSAVRVDPGNPQRVQANDGGGSWDDIQVTASAGFFTQNVPATAGSALQGGTGGKGVIGTDPNAGGGGGGGGGYYGGGGGGGGNDFGSGTRSSSGGGGGSGYINGTYVTGGSTGSYQDAPNRGSAGQSNGPSRVVIQ